MTNSIYVFGSVNGNNGNALNGARGTYVNPSNFAARDAAVFANGANIPISLRTDGQSPLSTVGFANQQLVTAESVGANTSAFLTSISSSDVPFSPARANPPSGVSGAPPTAQPTTTVNWRSKIRAFCCCGSAAFRRRLGALLRRPARPLTPATPSPISPMGPQVLPISPQAHSPNTVNFGAHNGAVTISGLDGTNYAGTAAWVKGTTSFATPATAPLMGNIGGRTAALNGSFFQGGPTNTTPLYGEMGGSLILNGTRLPRKRDFRRAKAVRAQGQRSGNRARLDRAIVRCRQRRPNWAFCRMRSR